MIQPAELYRPCVGTMVISKKGKIFLGRRRNRRLQERAVAGYDWQMPQGGIDPGEEPLAAALRELYEETNISSVKLLKEAADWHSYDLPVDIYQKSWKGRYRGQKQKWFAFRFEGQEQEINIITPGGGERPEFDAWRWEDIENLPRLVVSFKRPVYEKIVAEFAVFARPI